jgi:hypothetical protein
MKVEVEVEVEIEIEIVRMVDMERRGVELGDVSESACGPLA